MGEDMTKNQFLSRLHNALLWQYNQNEITEILEDYQELFESGEEDGETEEAMCSRFGKPEEIAAILKERKKPFISRKSSRYFISVMVMLIGVVIFFRIRSEYIGNQMLIYSMTLVVAVPLILWWLFGGSRNSLPYVRDQEVRKSLVYSFACHAFLILVEAFIYCAILLLCQLIQGRVGASSRETFFQYVDPWLLGPAFTKTLSFFYVVMIGVFAIDLFWFIKKSIRFFPYLCLVMGMICSGFCLENLLKQLDDPAVLSIEVLKTLLPFSSVLLAFLVKFIMSHLHQKEEQAW